jgi:hypothetical protein
VTVRQTLTITKSSVSAKVAIVHPAGGF